MNNAFEDGIRGASEAVCHGTAIPEVKTATCTFTSILKPECHWLIGALDFLSQKPEIAINGFRKPGILMHLKVMVSKVHTVPIA